MKWQKVIVILTMFSAMALCSGCLEQKQKQLGEIPKSWYVLPESSNGVVVAHSSSSVSTESATNVVPVIDRILMSTERALEKTTGLSSSDVSQNAVLHSQSLEESAPWRMGYFITDIAITFQGLLGLVMKGTPSVEMSWFPQYPATRSRLSATQSPLPNLSSATSPVHPEPSAQSEIVIAGDESVENVSRQIDPVVKAALGTGLVQDGKTLKRELVAQAVAFRNIANALDHNPGVQWWPSRYRVDFNIDASGKLTPAVDVGGGVRLRLAWYRMKRKDPVPFTTHQGTGTQTGRFDGNSQVQGFLAALAEDIETMSDRIDSLNGFKAYSIKVAIATTLKGTIGIAKTTGSLAGYLYFSRDVPKPIINPVPAPRTIAMIERTPNENHIQYARDNEIKFIRETSDDVVYDVDREDFRDGLKKAAKIASFFTERAEQLKPENKEAAWKIYELIIGFELSISGDVGLVQLGGSAITEISFYNQKF